MRNLEIPRLGARALPVAAIAAMVVFVGVTLAVAGETLGFDFLAYHVAVRRLLDGQQVYDMSFQAVQGWGLFYYPPAFLPLIVPFGFLDATVATWLFVALSLVAFAIGVAILPVSRSVRWWIVLLAGLSWPFVYAIKLGQVGPILFLTFAAGWRWLDEPVRFGLAGAIGAAIKIQPGILFAWALLTRRWRAIAVGLVVLAVLSILATMLAGLSAWTDFLTLMRRVADPIATERNLTPGAVLFRLGVDAGVAGLVQIASTIAVVALVVFAALRATAEASYMVAVSASQLLSPILWDHYAMLLLLPVAYLLSSGARWAILIPLVTATPLITVTPPAAYPVLFFVTLIATLAVGLRRPEPIPAAQASFA
jgi:hypothetical protein